MGFNLTGRKSFQPIKLKAIFNKLSIQHLRETRLLDDQEIEKLDDEHYKITAIVQETEQLFWWLLSFWFRVEVVEPIELKKKMIGSVIIVAEK